MPKPYSLDLRERVVRYVDEGHSRRAAAAHFGVSVSFVVNLVKAFRMRGASRPSPVAGAAMPSSDAARRGPTLGDRRGKPQRACSPACGAVSS